jgi:hypothetical protein
MSKLTFEEPWARWETTIAGAAVAIEPAKLPEASLAFVFEYGLRQYIQDGAAVTKMKTIETDVETEEGVVKRKQDVPKTADEIATEKREGVEARVANLLSGEFTRRGTGRVTDPAERERNAVLDEAIRGYVKTQGEKMPVKEALAKAREAVYAKNKDKVDREVARRLKDKSTFVIEGL